MKKEMGGGAYLGGNEEEEEAEVGKRVVDAFGECVDKSAVSCVRGL